VIFSKDAVGEYEFGIRKIRNEEWASLLSGFKDASIYQSWAYGAIRWRSERLEHAILRKNGEVVGIAQIAVISAPILRFGIAYIPSGPLWKRPGFTENTEYIRQLGRGLINEYARKRGLFLRLSPFCFENDGDALRQIFEEEGYSWSKGSYQTAILDLSPSLEEIRKKLAQKWRNQLNRSERNGLSVNSSASVEDFDAFIEMYQNMLERKKFEIGIDINQFREMQQNLPSSQKMRIFICLLEGKAVAGAVCSKIGDTGIYLLGATNSNGLQAKGSYLLQWSIIQWLKAENCQSYDLGGIDPENNPGVYHFKSGISTNEKEQIGIFEACSNVLSRLAVNVRDKIKAGS
jgi:lipid II:glycine glycyltransferase (peptidoglycan interpeptide bridge formation enzyme)